MLSQIESLNAAAEIVQKARIEASRGSSTIWAKINRVADYIESQIKEQMAELETA
jgi:hypothetical protein